MVELSGGAHIYQLVVTRRIVGDFIDKVILRIAEQLVKFIQNNGFDIHHLDFLELGQLKNPSRRSDDNFWTFLKALDLSLLTGTGEQELGCQP